MRATLRSNLFNPSTGRAQRSGASTGAKRLALGSHQFNALCLCVKTVSILKAPKIFNQKTPENPGRTHNCMPRIWFPDFFVLLPFLLKITPAG